MGFSEKAYQAAPSWAQTVLLNVYGLHLRHRRFGADFRALAAKWEESQWWAHSRLREMQDDRVRSLVRFAAERVPFYGRLWASHGANPAQVHGVTDLAMLPTLDKQALREAGASLLTRHRSQLAHGHTSGTTGSPLELWYDQSMVVANNLADWRQKRWGGLELGDWCALFLGRVIVPVQRSTAPFWRANHVQKQLWCSSFHLSEANLPLYVEEIARRGVRFLEGYPSTLFIIAQHLRRRGQALPMKAVFTSSETLHPVQRDALQAAFQCHVFDYYGMAERVIFAGECAHHGGKHLFDEYGVAEILDEAGQPVPDGRPGVLTGTSLWNRGMPLIRYRTSDISVRDAAACACGRGLSRLADITTKAEDVITTPDGRFISPSILTHPFKPFHSLLKSQLIQDQPDHVLVKLVPSTTFSDADRRHLIEGLRSRLGPTMRLDTEVVDSIPSGPSGKFRWVVCQVPHANALNWD